MFKKGDCVIVNEKAQGKTKIVGPLSIGKVLEKVEDCGYVVMFEVIITPKEDIYFCQIPVFMFEKHLKKITEDEFIRWKEAVRFIKGAREEEKNKGKLSDDAPL